MHSPFLYITPWGSFKRCLLYGYTFTFNDLSRYVYFNNLVLVGFKNHGIWCWAGFLAFCAINFCSPQISTTSATTSSRKENMRHDVDTDIFFIPTILLFFVSVTTRSSWAYGVSGISPRENSLVVVTMELWGWKWHGSNNKSSWKIFVQLAA